MISNSYCGSWIKNISFGLNQRATVTNMMKSVFMIYIFITNKNANIYEKNIIFDAKSMETQNFV